MLRVSNDLGTIRVIKASTGTEGATLETADVKILKSYPSYYIVDPINLLRFKTKLLKKDEQVPIELVTSFTDSSGYFYFVVNNKTQQQETQFKESLVSLLKNNLSIALDLINKQVANCNYIERGI